MCNVTNYVVVMLQILQWMNHQILIFFLRVLIWVFMFMFESVIDSPADAISRTKDVLIDWSQVRVFISPADAITRTTFGVVGLVFGNDDSTSNSNEDSYFEQLLDCISKGKLVEDRRNTISEHEAVVAGSHSAQLAFGAMGFPVLFGVLKERY